jgi:release factor glutamine methyltransferase
MTVNDWLIQASNYLEKAEIETTRLDTIILLEDCLSKDRSWILSHPETQLSSKHIDSLNKLLKRRANHEPIAYIRGKTEFYGREFVLTPAVLEPRPETETMIELLIEIVRDGTTVPNDKHILHIADVGTGSGAIGITVGLEIPNSIVELLDIDRNACKVAKMNVDKFTLNISVTVSDLLARSEKNFDILLCNLPYVPDSYHINRAALHEPRIAIFGGPDGLNVYRRLFDQIDKYALKPLLILTEALPPQHMNLQSIAKQVDYQLIKTSDFIQVFKHNPQHTV